MILVDEAANQNGEQTVPGMLGGNIVDPDVVGSIQYAVEHLDNKLIVVLGHQNCGAVTAALSPPGQTKDEPAEHHKLLDQIRSPRYAIPLPVGYRPSQWPAVEANARAFVKQLRQVPYIAALDLNPLQLLILMLVQVQACQGSLAATMALKILCKIMWTSGYT